ncbi:MAG: hypothetical protein ACRCV7_04170 [Culicoidibacterales bacterium]
MKRTRNIAIVSSVLLTVQSGVFGLLLLWFNRFSPSVFYHISKLPFRILVLYLGFMLGITCIYTAWNYLKPGFVASTFFMLVGLLGLVNAIQIPNIIFLIYTMLLSFGFIYVGVVGHYYRQMNSRLFKEKRYAKRKTKRQHKNKAISPR